MSLVPLSTATPHRGDVSSSDLYQGCILFLKKRKDVLETHFRSSGIKEKGFLHPVLVIQREGLGIDYVNMCPVLQVLAHITAIDDERTC